MFRLSYLGDAWYELWVREYVTHQVYPANQAHQQVTQLVCCQTQAQFADLLYEHLTKEEQAIFRRGQNKKLSSAPRHATMQQYRMSTAFECVIGYWYLSHQTERFFEIIELPTIRAMFEEMRAS